MRAEVTAQLGGRAAGPGDLAAMPLVEQVLEEAMRLYPPVGLLARAVLAKDELCGRTVQPNDIMFLPIWALHRHEMWWKAAGRIRSRQVRTRKSRTAEQVSVSALWRGSARLCGRGFRHDAGAHHSGEFDPEIPLHTRTTPGPHPVMMMTVRPEPGVFLHVAPA